MKDTGIVRKVDDLGRITVPRELLNIRDIGLRTPVEIYVDGPRIIIQKYKRGEYNGIVRNIDPLGRLTIPREILNIRGIALQSPVEIYVDGPHIICQKYDPGVYTAEDYKDALVRVCNETGKEPLKCLEAKS